MLKTKRLCIPLWFLCVALTGGGSAVRAQGNGSSSTQSKSGVQSSDLDLDREVDNGADDDRSNSDSEPGKFKKDTDDTYRDTSAEKDDSYHSRFKEARDKDDQETDPSN